jgi:hypothetical protein
MHVSVIRHLSPPLIGVCGPVHDWMSEAFEADLDALELSGVAVDRAEPDSRDDEPLPVVAINGDVRWRGRYPTRDEWVHVIGEARRAEGTSAR